MSIYRTMRDMGRVVRSGGYFSNALTKKRGVASSGLILLGNVVMLSGGLLKIGTRVIKKGGKVAYKGGKAGVSYLSKKGEEEREKVEGGLNRNKYEENNKEKMKSLPTKKGSGRYEDMNNEIVSSYQDEQMGVSQNDQVSRVTTETLYKLLDRLFLQPNIFCNWEYDKKKDHIIVRFDKGTDVYILTNRGVYNEEGENILERDISETMTKLTMRQREKHHKAIILIVGMYVKLGYIGED